MNKELERLIEMALANGQLPEKERFILFKKAEEMGVGYDDFEKILNTKISGKTKSDPTNIPFMKLNAGEELTNCPSCGAGIHSFSTVCASCGYEFRNKDASQTITKFFNRLDEIESERTENVIESKKVSNKLGCGTMIMWYFFFWILIPYNLIVFAINKSKPPKWSKTDSRKEELIMNYPIPNTREDMLEFLTLSISRIQRMGLIRRISEEGKYIVKWNGIWKMKCEQLYNKARLSMQDDRKTLQIFEEMMIKAKIIKKEK